MSIFTSRIGKPLEKNEHTELVVSFNKDILKDFCKYNCADYVIVGTLTPPDGRKEINGVKGFFYCSEKNRTYHYLDLAYCNDDLKNAKDAFRKTWSQSDKESIKKILRERHILLLDVIDKAYSKIGKSEDKDIMRFTLDYDSFSKIDFSKVKVVIANSLNAYEALTVISQDKRCQSLRKTFEDKKVFVIPQQVRGYSSNPSNNPIKPTYRSDSASSSSKKLEEDWKHFTDRSYLLNR